MRSAIPTSSHHFVYPLSTQQGGARIVNIAKRHLPSICCRLLTGKSLLIWYLWRTFNGLACMSLQVNNSVKRIIARRVQIFLLVGWAGRRFGTMYCAVAPLQVFVWSKLIVRSDCLDVFCLFFFVCGRIASAA